jgi:predicted enzyme related to lactoylglutathione lyase
MRLAYARIVTHDVQALASFYQQLTQIAPVVGSPDYVEFRTPVAKLAISSKRAVDAHNAAAAVPAANRSVLLEFQVEDVDKERARLGSFVADFVMEPTTQPWGNRSMLLRDPDGNLINLFAPVERNAAVASKPEPV